MNEPHPIRVDAGPMPPEGWDDFVREAPDASFCHLGGWGHVFRASLGLEPRFLTARAGERIEGVLPLVRMPRLGLGHELISVPYLNYGGPVGSERARAALAEAALDEAKSAGDRRLELRCRHDPPPGLSPGRSKITVILPLPDDPDVLFTDVFRSKLRSQIRRPMKEEMETRFGAGQVDPFYRVFSENMRDLGTPVLPRSLFEEIVAAFPDHVDFGAVYHDGRAVAAGGGFHFGDEFEMTWASSLREYNRLSPNMLLYWSFMERCVEAGRERFNFGRCTPGGGTHRFKSQWESEDEELHWVQWPAGAEGPTPEGGMMEKATELWSKLPLGVAERLGPVLARRIPTF